MRKRDAKIGTNVAAVAVVREEVISAVEEAINERIGRVDRLELAASFRTEIRKALGIPPQQHSVTPAQAFEILGLPWQAGYRLIRSGEIPTGKRNRRYSVTIETLASMLADWTRGQVQP